MSMIDGSMDDDRIAAETVSREARERLNAGSFEEAVVLYEKALASDPGRADDWVNKGLALWSLGRNQEALDCHDLAISIDPKHALAWLNRGNALHELGRLSEVLECYDR